MNVRKISAYCQEFGETTKAIDKRIENGIWVQGIHWFKVNGCRERWVDLVEVEKWVRNGGSSRAA